MTKKFLPFLILSLLSILLVASGPVGTLAFSISTISNAGDHNNETNPAVAFNSGFQREYLSVWQQENASGPGTTIYGQFLHPDGSHNGVRFPISPTSGDYRNPDIVYNPDSDRYLVVYQSGATAIKGQILTNAGTASGAEITIATDLATGDNFYSPAVAYSTGSGAYLITWMRAHGSASQGIQVSTLGNDGTTLHGPLDLTGMVVTGLPDQPDVAWEALNNRFLVVWQKIATPSTDHDIYGRMVSVSDLGPSTVSAVADLLSYGDDETFPSVGSIGLPDLTSQFLVACEVHSTPHYYVDGQLIAWDGSLSGYRLFISGDNAQVPAVAGNSKTHEYLVAWSHNPGSLQARTVQPNGYFGDIKNLSATAPWNATITTGALSDFLIAVEDDPLAGYPYDIYGYLWGNRIFVPLILR